MAKLCPNKLHYSYRMLGSLVTLHSKTTASVSGMSHLFTKYQGLFECFGKIELDGETDCATSGQNACSKVKDILA